MALAAAFPALQAGLFTWARTAWTSEEDSAREFARLYVEYAKGAQAGAVPANPALLEAQKNSLASAVAAAARARVGATWALQVEQGLVAFWAAATLAVFAGATSAPLGLSPGLFSSGVVQVFPIGLSGAPLDTTIPKLAQALAAWTQAVTVVFPPAVVTPLT